jgi:hypothetical protein
MIDGMSTTKTTTETEAPGDDHEARFHALIDYAQEISVGFDSLLISTGNDQPQARDDMPNALLFELEYLCRVQFDAACHDLKDPWLSHAAPTHLRPLLEGMAQIAFILGHETEHPIGTSQQRATCLGLARVREERDAMASANPDGVPEGNVKETQERVDIFEDMHQRAGCPYAEDVRDWPCRNDDGKPCDHRSAWPCKTKPAAARRLTTPTIRRLTKRMDFRFRDIEVASSLVLHMLLADRLWVDTGQGTNAFAAAQYGMRASTLALALSSYGVSLGWVMDTLSLPAALVLRDYVAAMWKQPDMLEIGSGTWDRPAASS